MLYKQGNKVQYGNSFFHIRIIFMFIVVEGHVFAVVGINAGSGNDRAAKITADVFYNSVSITEVWFGIDIETVFVFSVNISFRLFKGGPDACFEFI